MSNTIKEKEIETILAVDDEPYNLTILFHFLNNSGYKTLIAENGEIAVQKAKADHPDLILLDIMMPGIDGFETCIQLKNDDLTKDIPIIFITGLSDNNDKIKAFNIGAVDYITKPFNKDEVLARINTHLTIQRQKKNLENALAELKVLKGLIPICSKCKKIRNDVGYWELLETFIEKHSMAEFSHGICPDCAKTLYPDYYNEIKEKFGNTEIS